MTPEERARMNDLCVQVQNERNYQKFEELIREMTTILSAKESRFPESKLAQPGTGHKILQGTLTRTLRNPNPEAVDLVEIRVADAQPLYSEIRVENSFTDERGNALSLQPPATLEVRLQAPIRCFAARCQVG